MKNLFSIIFLSIVFNSGVFSQSLYDGSSSKEELFMFNLEQFMLGYAKICDIDYEEEMGTWERAIHIDYDDPCQQFVRTPYIDPYEQYLYCFLLSKEDHNMLYKSIYNPFDIRKLRTKTKTMYGPIKEKIKAFDHTKSVFKSKQKVWRMEYDFDNSIMKIYPRPLNLGIGSISTVHPVYHLTMPFSGIGISMVNVDEVISLPLDFDLAEKAYEGDVQFVVIYEPLLEMSKKGGTNFNANVKKIELYLKEGKGLKLGEITFDSN